MAGLVRMAVNKYVTVVDGLSGKFNLFMYVAKLQTNQYDLLS